MNANDSDARRNGVCWGVSHGPACELEGLSSAVPSCPREDTARGYEFAKGQYLNCRSQKIVTNVNTLIVSRARRFVWAQDGSQTFIAEKMSTELEPTPLFPNLGQSPRQVQPTKGSAAARSPAGRRSVKLCANCFVSARQPVSLVSCRVVVP